MHCLFNSRAQESDDDEDQIGSNAVVMSGGGETEGEDAGGIARELAARFHDLRTCSELVARHGAVLQRSLVDLEIPPSDITIQVAERATLFRISCNAMMNVSIERYHLLIALAQPVWLSFGEGRLIK